MSCNCNRRELTREEISEIFGIEWVSKDYGIYRVRSRLKEAEILEYKVTETTPEFRKRLNELKREAYVRIKLGNLLRRLFYRPCHKEEEPRILFRLAPAYFTNVKFHWGGLWFEGDIVTKFENQSEEGKEGIAWVRRREACPEEPDAYEWSVVEDSADLFADWLNKFWEDSTNTYLSSLRQALQEKLDPNNYITIRGHWQTSAFSMDTFMTMWNIFTSGTIVTRHGFDVTVSYNFNGEQTKMFHSDLRVRLPIRGEIQWWSL